MFAQRSLSQGGPRYCHFHLLFAVLGMEPWFSHRLGEGSAAKVGPYSPYQYINNCSPPFSHTHTQPHTSHTSRAPFPASLFPERQPHSTIIFYLFCKHPSLSEVPHPPEDNQNSMRAVSFACPIPCCFRSLAQCVGDSGGGAGTICPESKRRNITKRVQSQLSAQVGLHWEEDGL